MGIRIYPIIKYEVECGRSCCKDGDYAHSFEQFLEDIVHLWDKTVRISYISDDYDEEATFSFSSDEEHTSFKEWLSDQDRAELSKQLGLYLSYNYTAGDRKEDYDNLNDYIDILLECLNSSVRPMRVAWF
jgi:hypothetical protein